MLGEDARNTTGRAWEVISPYKFINPKNWEPRNLKKNNKNERMRDQMEQNQPLAQLTEQEKQFLEIKTAPFIFPAKDLPKYFGIITW